MIEPFVMKGDLWLLTQEGGYAWDAWKLEGRRIDNAVARHFGAEYVVYKKGDKYACDNEGNRHIGPVRITIERLEE